VRRLKAFGLFWWDFVVGDDWRMAIGVILTLGLGALAAHNGIPAWWLPPIAVVAVLTYSLGRAVRRP
jgi:hypothetical protein